MLTTYVDSMMKSYKKVGVIANNHRQVHGNTIRWNEASVAAMLIVLQHISKLAVSLQELLHFSSDLADYLTSISK